MTAWAWAALAGAASLITAALGDLVSEELRGWLDLAPNAILRLAATLLAQARPLVSGVILTAPGDDPAALAPLLDALA